MRPEVMLRRGPGDDMPIAPAAPMDEPAARHWLDDAFQRFGCDPVRASGKVLNVDKIVAVAQAASDADWQDAAWASAFASAALGALGRVNEPLLIDLSDPAQGRLR